MDNAQSSKGKIIAWFIVIAAVVIVYAAMTAKAHNASAEMDTLTSTTPTQKTGSTSGSPASDASNSTGSSSSVSSTGSFKDGTYTASNNYDVPHDVEGLSVTLTVKDGAVTGASIRQTGTNRESMEYQSAFQSEYQSYVVGKKLSDIQLNRVSGASLTSEAFNQAVSQIESQAQA